MIFSDGLGQRQLSPIHQRAVMRPIEHVLINGWSEAELAIAMDHLRVADAPGERADGLELAAELLRWLRFGASSGAPVLAEHINDCRPNGAEASVWDRLLTEPPSYFLLVELLAAYPNAVNIIIEVLDGVLDRRIGSCWDELDYDHQRYILALLAIGRPACLEYVVRNCSVLCGREIAELEPIVLSRSDGLLLAALAMWHGLSWSRRVSLVMVFQDLGLSTRELVELALASDPRSLTVKERVRYVTLLGCVNDDDGDSPRAQERIAMVFRDALSAGECDEDSGELLQEAFNYLDQGHLTDQEVARAASVGVSVARRQAG